MIFLIKKKKKYYVINFIFFFVVVVVVDLYLFLIFIYINIMMRLCFGRYLYKVFCYRLIVIYLLGILFFVFGYVDKDN